MAKDDVWDAINEIKEALKDHGILLPSERVDDSKKKSGKEEVPVEKSTDDE